VYFGMERVHDKMSPWEKYYCFQVQV